MSPLIITLLQWEFVVTTMVIFFSVRFELTSEDFPFILVPDKRHN